MDLGRCYATALRAAMSGPVFGPHDEAHRILMRAHSRLDQHHLALRQFEQCSRELRAELGMAPDVATLDLVEAIRQRRVV